jgi:hypothetical protein
MPDPVKLSSSVYMKSSFEINLLGGFETTNNTDILLEAKPMINPDGSDFRTVSSSDICNGFDFQLGYIPIIGIKANCNEPESANITWTVQDDYSKNTYSGSSITVPVPFSHNNDVYHVTCTANINGIQCTKSYGIMPIQF